MDVILLVSVSVCIVYVTLCVKAQERPEHLLWPKVPEAKPSLYYAGAND